MAAQVFGTQFNLFDLHNVEEDVTLKHCLRAFTILPKYCEFSDDRNKHAEEIVLTLKEIEKKAKMTFGIDWRKNWIERIGLKIKTESIGLWIIGRSPIPLIALEKLKDMGFKREIDHIMSIVTYVSSSTQDIVKIPRFLTPDILYLTGLLLSDGYLQRTNRKNENSFLYGVYIFSGDKSLLENEVIPILKSTFDFSNVRLVYRRRAWTMSKRNKVLFRFFTRIIDIPYGKKSIKSKIPQIVWSIDPEKAIPFLAGLIDGDIGRHGKSMGGTFRSEKFVDDVISYLDKLGVRVIKRKTNILKTGYIQNELYIPKDQVEVLKDIMVRTYLPKRLDRLNILFCRGTKAVKIASSVPGFGS